METFTPPRSAQANAKRVLAWREKYGDKVRGMTAVGWARARQLAAGGPVSLNVVRRMAQFARHQKNAAVAPEYRDEPWRDAGHVAWLGWGGDTGVSWAQSISSRQKEAGTAVTHSFGHGPGGLFSAPGLGGRVTNASMDANGRMCKACGKRKAERSGMCLKCSGLILQAREKMARPVPTAVTEKAKFSKASTQFDMPAPIRAQALLYASRIDPADLYTPPDDWSSSAIETDTHVTIKYGIRPDMLPVVSRIAAETPPMVLRFGPVTLFTTNDDFDVVKVEVESNELRSLNGRLSALPGSDNSRPFYNPHLTIAYVRKGAGSKYIGAGPLTGQSVTVNQLTFSDADGNKTAVPLQGSPWITRVKEVNMNNSYLLEKAKHLMGQHDQSSHGGGGGGGLSGVIEKVTGSGWSAQGGSKTKRGGTVIQRIVSKRRISPGNAKADSLRSRLNRTFTKERGYMSWRDGSGNRIRLTNYKINNGFEQYDLEITPGSTKEYAPTFSVFKDASGEYRWVAISSNSYRDRDQEIVSQAALEADCEYADSTKEYGPLRFWHVPGWDIGECDFNMMHGRMLIESGKFNSPAIGAAVAQAQKEYQLSIGFNYPRNEPSDGIYYHIRRFERSLVPSGRAANPFTSLSVTKENDMSTAEKQAKLLELLGDQDLMASVLNGASAAQKQADDMGIAFKEVDFAKLAQDPSALLEFAIKNFESAQTKAEKKEEMEDEEEKPADTAVKGMDAYMKKMDDYMAKMDGYMSKMGGSEAKKETQPDPVVADAQAATKAANELTASRVTDLETAVKELTTKLQSALGELETARKEASEPVIVRGMENGVRPSQANSTVKEGAVANVEQNNPNAAVPDQQVVKSFGENVNGFMEWLTLPPQ